MEIHNSFFDEMFASAPYMTILRGMGEGRTAELASISWDIGIEAVEVPIQTDKDVEALKSVSEMARMRNKVVGAGTITSSEQIEVAQDSGASFLVSPGLDITVIREAWKHGIPCLPGVSTPSEVQAIRSLGLTWAKAFPARWLGPDWFSLMRGPFPDVQFVATGGINAHNVQEFLVAGARVAAFGSALEDPEQLRILAQSIRGQN